MISIANGVQSAYCNLCGRESRKIIYQMDFANLMQCPHCSLYFLWPQPTEEFLSELYSESYFTGEYAPYFEGSANFDIDEIAYPEFRDYRCIVENLQQEYGQKGKLLDVGCGLGGFLRVAKKAGFEVQGVELTEYGSQFARNNFGLEVFQGTLEETHFPSGSFDVVTALDLFEHLYDPLAFVKEVSRILKKGGIFFVQTINAHSLLNYIAHILYWGTKGRLDWPVRRLYGPWHIFYYTRPSFRSYMERAGLTVQKIYGVEYAIHRIPNIAAPVRIGMRIAYGLQRLLSMQTNLAAYCVRR